MAGRNSGEQLSLTFRTHGGRRTGAGRPRKKSAGVPHLVRPKLSLHHPVHVTLRVAREPSNPAGGVAACRAIQSLRGSAMFRSIRKALAAGRNRFGFRLVHFSVQRDHLHLLAEANERRALSRGMQGLAIRVAKAVNRRLRRHGTVFGDRYHAHVLRTPREARSALRYVLSNVRKHGRGASHLPEGFIDGCSSAAWFDGWNRPLELCFGGARTPPRAAPPVIAPRTWLLCVGWLRAGPLLDPDESPRRPID